MHRSIRGLLFAPALAAFLGIPAAGQEPGSVLLTEVEGPITPVIADYLEDGVAAAEGGHEALVLRLDTPGGLDQSMRDIVQVFLGARVPVVVYVSPSGGRAASAGTFITMAAHVAAMAPGTTIGAATPVDLQGGEVTDKIINDAASFAEAVAAFHDRDVDFAIAAVREGRSITAEEALELGVVDLIAADLEALLTRMEGRSVTVGGSEVTLRTRGVTVERFDPGFFRNVLRFLADPNLAFLFLSLGTLAVIYELSNPGMGLAGIVGVILLIMGFFALSVLPVNIAGAALLILAAALFVAELFVPGVGVLAAGGTIALLLGGVFLFEGPFGIRPAVVVPAAVVVGGGVLLATRLTWRARRAPAVSGPQALIGRDGVIHSVDGNSGQVFVEGAWWRARSRDAPIREGERVTVVGVEGLELIVEERKESS